LAYFHWLRQAADSIGYMIEWLAGRVAHQITRLGFEIGSSLARRFPRTIYWSSDRLAAVAFVFFRSFRRRSIRNITVFLGSSFGDAESEKIARESLKNFFRACAEMVTFMDSTDEQLKTRIVLEGRQNLDEAVAKGNGVLVLSAHLGNFFLVGTRLAVEGFPVSVLVNQPKDGQFAQMMDSYRLQIRQQTIHARPRRQALQQLQTVLRRNEVAVVIADEYRKGNGVPVPLFGKTVIARRGPVTLALRTGAALIPVCLVRQEGGTLKMIIEPEIELDRSTKGKIELADNTIRITQWLERTVRQYPGQWNWTNIRWWRDNGPDSAKQPEHLREAS
jgi:KDO2-lipid IV(A) lauroyltransferase